MGAKPVVTLGRAVIRARRGGLLGLAFLVRAGERTVQDTVHVGELVALLVRTHAVAADRRTVPGTGQRVFQMSAEGVAARGWAVATAGVRVLFVSTVRVAAECTAIVPTTDRRLRMCALSISAGCGTVLGAGTSGLFSLAGPVAANSFIVRVRLGVHV
jgi:hypothetical protein